MSLHYSFPRITNIRDVLPYIDECFRVVEKEGLTFINYVMMGSETFPSFMVEPETVDPYDGSSQYGAHCIYAHNLRAAIRRECRGIVFDTITGDIVSRPFHKFFNAGEREELALDLIDVSRPHFILEKLDGSMIRPLPTSGGIRWGTKMGITDVGMVAECFVATRPEYVEFAEQCMEKGLTPLFEFCSRDTRIVLDYPEDRMVLTGIRNNVSGGYTSHADMKHLGAQFGFEVVNRDFFMVEDMVGYVADVKQEDSSEGVVIRFHDGHMLKVKNDWYVRVHRAKDMIRSEMRLLDLVLNEELDDLLPTLMDEDRGRVLSYVDSFYNEVNHAIAMVSDLYGYARAEFETKKDFALGKKDMDASIRSIIFGLWDGKHKNCGDAVLKVIRAGMSSETKFAEMKSRMNLNTGWDEIWGKNVMEEAA